MPKGARNVRREKIIRRSLLLGATKQQEPLSSLVARLAKLASAVTRILNRVRRGKPRYKSLLAQTCQTQACAASVSTETGRDWRTSYQPGGNNEARTSDQPAPHNLTTRPLLLQQVTAGSAGHTRRTAAIAIIAGLFPLPSITAVQSTTYLT